MKFVQTLISLVALLAVVPSAAGKKNDNNNKNKRNGGNNGQKRSKNCLYQEDFDKGTVIISKPGRYRLCENISFRPNFPANMTDDDFESLFDPDLDVYSPFAYGLGFFSAIAIEANGVQLDLNGFTLEQSPEHALMQRFFALIELASSPFIRDVGPSSFVGEKEKFSPATNVVIRGPGILGRSSHHGIHGNQNQNVTINRVHFQDYEVAAVSLNNVDGLKIRNCKVLHNRGDVPVVGSFSAARFIQPYVKKLMENGYSMVLRQEEVSAAKVYENLITATKNVFEDVMTIGFIDASAHPEEFHLFDNPKRVVDGPCYGFLVHGFGPAVGDFGYILSKNQSETSSHIQISDNEISNLHCWNNEIPSAIEGSRVVNDIRGAMLQFEKTHESGESRFLAMNPDGTYKGNLIADAQIMVANAILEANITDSPGLQVSGVNSINRHIIWWARGVGPESRVYTPRYRCNGDSMHHVIKGVIGIRVDKAVGFLVSNNVIQNITNLSEEPFKNCYDYHFSNPENQDQQQLGNIRAISVAAVGGYAEGSKPNVKRKLANLSKIKNNKIIGCGSQNGNSIVGIDVQGQSVDLLIENNNVDLDMDGKMKGHKDRMVGLRIRSHVANCTERGNILKNGRVIEEADVGTVRRGLRAHDTAEVGLPEGHSPIEWVHGESPGGGCPFARAQQ